MHVYIYIYIYIYREREREYRCLWKKHSSGEECIWEDRLSEGIIRGWRAVLRLYCRARARLKGVRLFSQTPVSAPAADGGRADLR